MSTRVIYESFMTSNLHSNLDSTEMD